MVLPLVETSFQLGTKSVRDPVCGMQDKGVCFNIETHKGF